MYWIAIIVFSIGVMVPEIVRNDSGPFREDEIEVVMLLLLNGVLFFIFLWTDRALRALGINQRTSLQESRDATKDLSKAYGHIGEMNRKVDVVAHYVQCMTEDEKERSLEKNVPQAIKESVETITRCRDCHVYLFDAKTQNLLHRSAKAPRIPEQAVQKMFKKHSGHKIMLSKNEHIIIAARRSSYMPHIYILCHKKNYEIVSEHAFVHIIMAASTIDYVKKRKNGMIKKS